MINGDRGYFKDYGKMQGFIYCQFKLTQTKYGKLIPNLAVKF